MKNLSLAKWKAGERSIGAWVNLTDAHAIENLARLDLDWLCFDLQHGLLSIADLPTVIAGISGTDTTPLVRVVSNHAGEIGRALDAGAHGVIVPMVDTAQDAALAASACRYPPAGRRSCGPMRGAMLEGFEYLATANAQIACIVMIETAEGLANVRAIAETPGIDALFVGPLDLCYGLGVTPGDFANPRFVAALDEIKAASLAAGKAVGIFGYSAELAQAALASGFSFASMGTDISFFRDGAKAALGVARGDVAAKAATVGAGY